MLTVDQARQLIERELPAERVGSVCLVPLAESRGRTLAEDVASDIDSPPHDKSIVDGYAVDAASISSPGVILHVVEEVTAGRLPTQRVSAGKATRIMTGAPLPAGATAVVMVERTRLVSEDPPRVQLEEVPRLGQNIARQATSLRRGEVVLKAGRRLGPAHLGLLAEVGKITVPVRERPRVAILPTGDEIVPAGAFPGPGQIRNSNGPMLAALVQQLGATAIPLDVAPDEEEALTRLIKSGLEGDLLVLSGGVSAGVLDLVPAVLARLGVQQVFHKVNLKPGKPIWFGTFARDDGTKSLIFGLPGNPVSSYVCFELFVRFAMARIIGGGCDLEARRGRLAAAHQQRGERPTWWPAIYSGSSAPPSVALLPWQGSGDLRTLADANCLAFFPGEERLFAAGDEIEAFML